MRPFRPQYFARSAGQIRRARVQRQSRRGFSSIRDTSPTDPEIYDVVCVGGGPVGLSLVNAIRSNSSTAPLRVALIDATPLSQTSSAFSNAIITSPSSFSNRCSSLTPASYSFLSNIGAEDHLMHPRVHPYNLMKVWDGITNQHITFDWATASGFSLTPPSPPSASASTKPIAYMTENNNIVSALLARSAELDSTTPHPLDLLDSTKVASISLGTDSPSATSPDLSSWPIITLSSGRRLAARLLVGADGANSVVRSFAGIESRGWDYDRHGVVATLQLAADHAPSGMGTAYQRFLPSGPIAWLPMPGARATLVWSTHPAWAARLKQLAEPDLVAMVNAGFRLGSVDVGYLHSMAEGQREEVPWREEHTRMPTAPLLPPRVVGVQAGSVASFPLKFRHADTYVGERVALIGDAAHTVHPLAGQGLNAGLGDAEALARVIVEAREAGADLGDQLVLERYNRARYTQNHVLMGVVDKLHKVYSWESGPVVWGRSLGLGVVERLGGLKGLIMGQAEGAR